MATHSSVLAWSIPWSLMCYHLWDCKESDISTRVWVTNDFTFFIVSSTEEVWDVLLKQKLRTSLAIQWLRLHNPSAGTKVWSLVEELRSCMLWDGLKKKKKDISTQYSYCRLWYCKKPNHLIKDVYICLFVFAAKFNLLLAHEIDFTINHQYFLRYFYEMIMYTFVNHINFTYVYVCLYSSFWQMKVFCTVRCSQIFNGHWPKLLKDQNYQLN